MNWILDADIRSFFDSVSQEWLVRFIEHRIGDQRIIRLVRKWLKAGVLEEGELSVSETDSRALGAFRYHVVDLWRRALRRRSQKDHMTWTRVERIADAWLPPPRILHPWPDRRFAVKHPR
ncbi:hypothetical protein [Cupriavidus necator]